MDLQKMVILDRGKIHLTETESVFYITDMNLGKLSMIMNAIADPNRLRIVKLLENRELSAHDISEILGISQSQTSKHLKLLIETGFVLTDRWGAFNLCRLPGYADLPTNEAQDLRDFTEYLKSLPYEKDNIYEYAGKFERKLKKPPPEIARALKRLIDSGCLLSRRAYLWRVSGEGVDSIIKALLGLILEEVPDEPFPEDLTPTPRTHGLPCKWDYSLRYFRTKPPASKPRKRKKSSNQC